MTILDGLIPRYLQLQTILRERIERGEVAPGDMLPSETQLCDTYGISRITVNKALSGLISEGLIERRQGVGTFVRSARPLVKTVEMHGSVDEFLRKPVGGARKVIVPPQYVRSPSFVSELMGLSDEDQLLFSEHSFQTPEGIYSFSRQYVNPALLPDQVAESSHEDFTIYGLEVRVGRKISHAEQFIEPVIASADIASHIAIAPGSAVLRTVRTYFLHNEEALMVVEAWYNPQRYRYIVRLDRPPV